MATHLYGIASLILGILSIGIAFYTDKKIVELFLIASGWILALLNYYLVFVFVAKFEKKTEEVMRLKSENETITSENKQLILVSSTVSNLVKQSNAKPRKISPN